MDSFSKEPVMGTGIAVVPDFMFEKRKDLSEVQQKPQCPLCQDTGIYISDSYDVQIPLKCSCRRDIKN